jgi:hypothetical protein
LNQKKINLFWLGIFQTKEMIFQETTYSIITKMVQILWMFIQQFFKKKIFKIVNLKRKSKTIKYSSEMSIWYPCFQIYLKLTEITFSFPINKFKFFLKNILGVYSLIIFSCLTVLFYFFFFVYLFVWGCFWCIIDSNII